MAIIHCVCLASISLKKPWICGQRVIPQLLMVIWHLLWLYWHTWEWQYLFMHVKTLFPDVTLFSFHWVHFSLAASLAWALGVNHISSVSDHLWCLSTSQWPRLSPSRINYELLAILSIKRKKAFLIKSLIPQSYISKLIFVITENCI